MLPPATSSICHKEVEECLWSLPPPSDGGKKWRKLQREGTLLEGPATVTAGRGPKLAQRRVYSPSWRTSHGKEELKSYTTQSLSLPSGQFLHLCFYLCILHSSIRLAFRPFNLTCD